MKTQPLGLEIHGRQHIARRRHQCRNGQQANPDYARRQDAGHHPATVILRPQPSPPGRLSRLSIVSLSFAKPYRRTPYRVYRRPSKYHVGRFPTRQLTVGFENMTTCPLGIARDRNGVIIDLLRHVAFSSSANFRGESLYRCHWPHRPDRASHDTQATGTRADRGLGRDPESAGDDPGPYRKILIRPLLHPHDQER